MSIPVSGEPFTMSARLCDDDGIVRGGPMRHGTDYTCTGHAHYAGEHIRCESPAHPGNLPADVLRLLSDPFVTLPRDGEVWRLLGSARAGTQRLR